MENNQFEGGSGAIDIRQEVRNAAGQISGEIELRVNAVQAVMDAKIDGVRHETDAKIERTQRTIWVSAISTGVGVVLALIAVAALSGVRFEGGASVSQLVQDGKAEQIERDRQQDERLERVIKLLEEKNGQSKKGG